MSNLTPAIERIHAESDAVHAELTRLELAGDMGRSYDRGMAWLDRLTAAHNTLVQLDRQHIEHPLA